MYKRIRTAVVTALVEYVKKNKLTDMLIERDDDSSITVIMCEEFQSSYHKKYARLIKITINETIEEVA